MKDIRITLGKRITELREARSMTTYELACICGLSESNIIRIENGRYSAPTDILQRIADALNATLDIVPKN